MDTSTRQLIEALHRAPCRCVLALTGGGTQAAGLLLNVPGGSRTVLEIVVPYHERALVEFLGHEPENYCSAGTGRDLARRAYERAVSLAPGETVVGVGCTAGLATDRPKRGDHRFYIAVRTATGTSTYSLTLAKGARDREGEEAVLDAVLLNALAIALGINERLTPALVPGEEISCESIPLEGPFACFLQGEIPALCAEPDGRLRADAPRPAVLLSGAFNPVHQGHWGMAAAGARRSKLPVAFELSILNVDKPPLTAEEIRRRVHQFAWRAPLWLTRAATFVEKAKLFPGVLFLIGADTAARIVACRYYQDDETKMSEALEQIRAQGCRFLVAGRAGPLEEFVALEELALPERFRDLFTGIPEQEFRLDISSTNLRQRGCSSGD